MQKLSYILIISLENIFVNSATFTKMAPEILKGGLKPKP